jgi:hypothetical protein
LTANSTLTLAGVDGKTLTVNSSLTLTGTDATTMTFPTTSATLARTDAGQTFTGTNVFSSAPQVSTLTNTRVVYAGASGVLQDNANLTFDGTSLTMGGNPTLSAGTANGVLYLNGSKVVSSGSALTFDGTNFATTGASTGLRLIASSTDAGGSVLQIDTTATAFGRVGGSTTMGYVAGTQSLWTIGGSEQMRLTSTGLGIGTSPAYKLHVQNSAANTDTFVGQSSTVGLFTQWRYNATAANAYGEISTYGGSTSVYIQAQGGGGNTILNLQSGSVGIGTSSPGAKLDVVGSGRFVGIGTPSGPYGGQVDIYTNNDAVFDAIWVRNDSSGSSATAGIVLNASGNGWRMAMGSSANNSNALSWIVDPSGSPVTHMTLTTSGNLGLGVTPSAWAASLRGFDIGTTGALVADTSNNSGFAQNAYYGSGAWTYKTTNFASLYSLTASGQHHWYTATSGTAGNPISFTQALTLDASRNLLLNGTAAPASGVGTFAIFNGTAPTGSVADGCVLYTEDVSSSSELKVRDEAGNVTTLSPHNFELIPEGPSEDMAWSYYSERDGKRINVDMLKAIRLLEKLSGEQLVYEA